MGNCTATIKRRTGLTPTGNTVIADIALSGSYATGGDTVPLSTLGMRSISALIISGPSTPGGHAIEVIHGAAETTAPLLRVRDVATGSELANASNNSAQSVRVLAIGDIANL